MYDNVRNRSFPFVQGVEKSASEHAYRSTRINYARKRACSLWKHSFCLFFLLPLIIKSLRSSLRFALQHTTTSLINSHANYGNFNRFLSLSFSLSVSLHSTSIDITQRVFVENDAFPVIRVKVNRV